VRGNPSLESSSRQPSGNGQDAGSTPLGFGELPHYGDMAEPLGSGRALRVAGLRTLRSGPRYTRNTFMTSSPRWLMTFTAMRPDCGFAKGREMDLRSDSQASRAISALSDVFRLL